MLFVVTIAYPVLNSVLTVFAIIILIEIKNDKHHFIPWIDRISWTFGNSCWCNGWVRNHSSNFFCRTIMDILSIIICTLFANCRWACLVYETFN